MKRITLKGERTNILMHNKEEVTTEREHVKRITTPTLLNFFKKCIIFSKI